VVKAFNELNVAPPKFNISLLGVAKKHKTLFGKNMVKYTKKMNLFIFTLYHAYKTKQVA
jgi:hypothetical protein